MLMIRKKCFDFFTKSNERLQLKPLALKKILDMQPGTFYQKLGKRQVNIITDSGGEDAWIALPENVRKQRSEDAYQDLIIEIGEEEWSNLYDEQQEDMM